MAIDFSFPQWMRDQQSFADSLAKGAQVGAIIANNRYRNQALAAQAIQAEREYELRDRQLAAQVRTDDLNYRLKSQLIEDQTADKAAISDWIQQRNQIPLEERVGMSLPELRLTQSYQIANQVVDNDRMAYERSVVGQVSATKARILGAVPELAQDYFDATDPDEKREILQRAREQYVKQQPATIAAESRIAMMEQRLSQMLTVEGVKAENRKELETLRADLQMLRDQMKPQSGSHYDLPYSTQILMKSELDELSRRIRDEGLSTDEAAVIRRQIEQKYRTSAQPIEQPKGRVRVKAPDGRIGTISADKLEEALRQGYQRAE